MSDAERPDLAALEALEEMLRLLEAELASWRRRALAAESRAADLLRTLEQGDDAPSRSRQLEDRGNELEQRLEHARARVGDLIARLAFLEEQADDGGNGGATIP